MNFNFIPFVSLKWKVVLLISISLLLMTAVITSINYLDMRGKFAERREAAYQLYSQQIRGLIKQNSARLLQLSTIVASLPEIRKALVFENSIIAKEALEEFWPSLRLSMGVEVLSIYSSSGQLLVNLGTEHLTETHSSLLDIVPSVISNEQPSKISICIPNCMDFIVVPVLGHEKSVGAIALGASVIDIVLGFHGLTQSDMGLISYSFSGVPIESKNSFIPNWGMQVEALTNKSRNIEILRHASDIFPFDNLSESSTNIELGKLTYELRFTEFPGFSQSKPPYIVLISDITASIESIRKTTNNSIALGVAALLGSGLLVVGFLWKPLIRLRLAANNLPLLAQGDFTKVKTSINQTDKGIKDEIHILEDTTIQTAILLENLQNIVSERNQTLSTRMQELRREKAFANRVLDTAQVIILTQSDIGGILLLNRYGQTLTGFTTHELQGKPFTFLLSENNILPDVQRRLNDLFKGKKQKLRQDGELICKDSSIRSVVWHHSRLGGPTTNLILSVGLDITDRKVAETRLSWLASRDPLTGAFNRHRFHEELSEAVARAQRYGHDGALLFMDLDKFKYINDTSGHQQGDLVIREVGKKLQRHLRENVDIVGRIGGDEFAIVLPEGSALEAETVAEKLLNHLSEIHINTGGRIIKVSASIGIALFPSHGIDVQELLTAADLAMYHVKDAGRGGWRIYSPEDQSLERLHRRVLRKELIERALRNKSFSLYFQPICETNNGLVDCYEVLLRIYGDDDEIIPTTQVIRIAEQEGLIHLLDRVVFEESVKYLAALQDCGFTVNLFVNFSPYAFGDPDLLLYIKSILGNSKINPEQIVIEITETAALADMTTARDLVLKIKKFGCRFALDDFGVGFSSFHHLQELPVDIVKIDGSYIQRIAESKRNQTLVNVINELAHDANILTVAEFVEDSETLDCLKSLGVDYAQGYFIGRPAPAIDVFGGFVVDKKAIYSTLAQSG